MKRRKSQGFTLLEMLVVLVILGLLMGLVGPRMFGKVDSSKVKTAQTQIKMIRGALETYRLDMGSFPDDKVALKYLYARPTDSGLAKRWQGPYLDDEVPLDPWGNAYLFNTNGREGQPFALYSLGADGQIGGEGTNEDIGYLPAQ